MNNNFISLDFCCIICIYFDEYFVDFFKNNYSVLLKLVFKNYLLNFNSI